MSAGNLLITGGSRGIGAATVKLAIAKGYRVAFTYRQDKAAADLLIGEISELGDRALGEKRSLADVAAGVSNGAGTAPQVVAYQLDVSDPSGVESVFTQAVKDLGSIHGLVNNAGIVAPCGRFVDFSTSRLQRLLAVNVAGSMYCAQAAIRHMAIGKGGVGGCIVNLSSAAARLGSPFEYVDYAASKGAIDTLTIGLAKEVAEEGIRVNAVRPGLIQTEIHGDSGDLQRPEKLANQVPLKRPGRAEEVAETILWLCSPAASYVNGAIVDVTGGR